MAKIQKSVGIGAVNQPSDVAMIEALLCVIARSNGTRYMSSYDGAYAPATGAAISQFQQDNGIVGPPGNGSPSPTALDTAGFMSPNGPTIAMMNRYLTGTANEHLTVIPGQTTVYWPASPADATLSKNDIIGGSWGFEPAFAKLVAELVDLMYTTHKIVLKVARKGGLRTFEQQYHEATDQLTDNQGNYRFDKNGSPLYSSNAGPGESIHNYGMAVDLGFDGFKWVGVNGNPVTDDAWLSKLSKQPGRRSTALWNARDALAYGANPKHGNVQMLFPTTKKGDIIHLQKFDDANINTRKSLARLLNTVGTMQWKVAGQIYSSDLGLGGRFYTLGKSETIWDQNATVTAANLQAAQQAVGQPVQASAKDVADMQKKVKSEFELAEQNRLRWVPVP